MNAISFCRKFSFSRLCNYILSLVFFVGFFLFFLVSAYVYSQNRDTAFAMPCLFAFIFLSFTHYAFQIPSAKVVTNKRILLATAGAIIFLFWWVILEVLYEVKLNGWVQIAYAIVQITYLVLATYWYIAKVERERGIGRRWPNFKGSVSENARKNQRGGWHELTFCKTSAS